LLKAEGNLPKAIDEFKNIMHRNPQQKDIAEIIQWGYR
jgi:hypothetical protein